jgi:hypothetical protein
MIHGRLRLACWTAAVIVVWLVILPWVAVRPDMQRRIEFLEQRRIDPSAMFYTEVESMNEVRQRMAQRRRQQPHTVLESVSTKEPPMNSERPTCPDGPCDCGN